MNLHRNAKDLDSLLTVFRVDQMYSLNNSILDYESSDIDHSVSERGDSLLDEMTVPHTQSFQE